MRLLDPQPEIVKVRREAGPPSRRTNALAQLLAREAHGSRRSATAHLHRKHVERRDLGRHDRPNRIALKRRETSPPAPLRRGEGGSAHALLVYQTSSPVCCGERVQATRLPLSAPERGLGVRSPRPSSTAARDPCSAPPSGSALADCSQLALDLSARQLPDILRATRAARACRACAHPARHILPQGAHLRLRDRLVGVRRDLADNRRQG